MGLHSDGERSLREAAGLFLQEVPAVANIAVGLLTSQKNPLGVTSSHPAIGRALEQADTPQAGIDTDHMA